MYGGEDEDGIEGLREEVGDYEILELEIAAPGAQREDGGDKTHRSWAFHRSVSNSTVRYPEGYGRRHW